MIPTRRLGRHRRRSSCAVVGRRYRPGGGRCRPWSPSMARGGRQGRRRPTGPTIASLKRGTIRLWWAHITIARPIQAYGYGPVMNSKMLDAFK